MLAGFQAVLEIVFVVGSMAAAYVVIQVQTGIGC